MIDLGRNNPQADIDRVLIPRERIAARVAELAGQIIADVDNTPIALAALMTGSLIFAADLIRHLPVRMRIHLVNICSYPGQATQSQGPRLMSPLPEDLSGQTVLLLDDVLDSGRTLARMVDELRHAGAESVRTCVLLVKPASRRAPDGLQSVDYAGFDIEDEFVVGYGLDFDDYYRNLPDIAVLKRTGEK